MRVFIADDNVQFAEYCAAVARRDGWSVTLCHDGRDLIGALAESDRTDPALLLVDVQMPDLDGIQAIDSLSDLGGRYRVRFITGGPPSSAMAARMIAQARDLSVGRFLTKPIEMARLKEVLAEEAEFLAEMQTSPISRSASG